MAREQGDELGDEVVYTHPDDDERTETAYTATDRVNLEARGWRRREQSPTASFGSRPVTPPSSETAARTTSARRVSTDPGANGAAPAESA